MSQKPSLRPILFMGLAGVLGALAACFARAFTGLIDACTNLAFFGRISLQSVSPADNSMGLPGILVIPMLGGLIVGIMARFGAPAIRGHGIPEAMERILKHGAHIPARLIVLKPLASAVAIGTGGPFGAEGPIIATGGALGSWLGHHKSMTEAERKTLVACGAAAGMAATFGAPVSATLLAVELLLFEYRAASLLPVAFAAAVATQTRYVSLGAHPAFVVPTLPMLDPQAFVAILVIGGLSGLIATGVTRACYWVEDAFERLPMHWMYWPVGGGLVVGLMGWLSPHTLGVGYDNIERIAAAELTGSALALFVLCKWISWTVALGSGTSGGTLAPLFTLGGGIGALSAEAINAILPTMHVDPRLGALVGMAALFAGASRAFLTSVVFAFETTWQVTALLPVLAACAVAVAVSRALMTETIMTEKLARRGLRVPSDYIATPSPPP